MSFVAESPSFTPESEPSIEVGQRVRFLVSIPESCVEIGDVGRVCAIDRRDDTNYYIETTGGRVMLFDSELWKIEVLP